MIEPGSTTVNVGQIDGINIYDLDGDGKSEVYIRIANNFTFGDGYVFTRDNDIDQWIACVDELTGKLLQKAKLPNFFPQYGPMGTLFGVGWLSLEKPSLIVVFKNRDDKKRFYNYVAAFSFTNNMFKMDWNWTDSYQPDINYPEGHHFRIADVDFDGIDEIHEIGYVLNGNGTIRFNLGTQRIIHGDRFYVAKFNNEDTTMSGYGIQQNNPDLIDEYFYNASTGEMKWIHYGTTVHDVGRRNAGDFDPTVPGLEVFSFQGMYNAKTNTKLADNFTNTFWPSNNVYWDGTLNPACYDRGHLNKWNYKTKRGDRLFTANYDFNKYYGQFPAEDEGGHYPLFHGDILGDWREEFIMAASNFSEIVIFTTNLDTDIKMTTLWHDPGMRASM
ncbi:FG-GAP repeat family, partial [Trichomonas vaginalis G3]